jgi:hypothetical protein
VCPHVWLRAIASASQKAKEINSRSASHRLKHAYRPQTQAWRKQLRVGLEPATAPALAGFAAVALAPSASPADGMTPRPPGLIEIELAGGDRVRISGAPDPEVVAAALRTLAGR